MTDQKTLRIAKLNDLARTAMGVASKVVQTSGVFALQSETQSRIREAVERFDAFTEDNDPYGEHDFGSLEIDGAKLFWKIDYYADTEYQCGAEDPSDPSTARVLTIMLRSEY